MDVFTTADGRDIEYVEVGDPSGQPVVYLHGTPGTAGSGVLLEDAAAALARAAKFWEGLDADPAKARADYRRSVGMQP